VNGVVRKLKCIKGEAVKVNEGTSEKCSWQEQIMKSSCYLRTLLIQASSCHRERYSASLLHYGNASLRSHLSGFLLQMKLTQWEFITTHLLRQSKPCCKSGSTAWWALPEEALTNAWQTGLHHQKGSSSFSWSQASWQQAGGLGGWCDSCRVFAGNVLQQDRNHTVCLDQVCPGCRRDTRAVYKGDASVGEIRQNAAGLNKGIHIYLSLVFHHFSISIHRSTSQNSWEY